PPDFLQVTNRLAGDIFTTALRILELVKELIELKIEIPDHRLICRAIDDVFCLPRVLRPVVKLIRKMSIGARVPPDQFGGGSGNHPRVAIFTDLRIAPRYCFTPQEWEV